MVKMKNKRELTIFGKILHFTKAVKFDENGKNGKIRLLNPLGLIIFITVLVIVPFVCSFIEQTTQETYRDLFKRVCLF